jgi:hypothetical protein
MRLGGIINQRMSDSLASNLNNLDLGVAMRLLAESLRTVSGPCLLRDKLNAV